MHTPFKRITFSFPETDPAKRELETLLYSIHADLKTIGAMISEETDVIENVSPNVELDLIREYEERSHTLRRLTEAFVEFKYNWAKENTK